LLAFIAETISGRELADMAFADDVALSSDLNVSKAVPVMLDEAYVRMTNSE
jgi:hypothetical protein